MISFLRGTVAHVGLSTAVIDLNGAGMSVNATPQTLSRLHVGEEGKLFTSLIVREDSMTLFGFARDDEREVFDILLSVSGVGPRLALAVLAVHEPEAIRVAAHTGDSKTFTKVPGIGPKVGRPDRPGTGRKAGAARNGRRRRRAHGRRSCLEAAGGGRHDQPGLVRKGRLRQHRQGPRRRSRGLVPAATSPEILRTTLRWLGQDGARAGNRVGSRG